MIWKRDGAALRHAVAEEMRVLDQIAFGREAMPAQPDSALGAGPAVERLVAQLTSPGFTALVAGPALDGLFDPALDQPLEDAAQAFARRQLGVRAVVKTRRDLLARVLHDREIAKRLKRAGVVWSPHALACVMEGKPADASTSPTAITRAQAVASGVMVLDAFGLQADPADVALRPTPGRHGFRLGLDSEARGDFVEVHVGLLGGSSKQGGLRVEYEDGSVCELDLYPRGRIRYLAAVLAATAHIRTLEWDLGELAAPVRLRSLTARPRTRPQIASALRQAAGEWALDWLAGDHLPPLQLTAAEPAPVRVSRQLTRRMGAHMQDGQPSYEDWLSEWEPTPERALAGWRRQAQEGAARDAFAIFLPFSVDGTAEVLQTLASVTGQVYARWSLHLAAEDAGAAAKLQRASGAPLDSRVTLQSPGPSGAATAERLNAMLRTCQADWVIALEPGDVLARQALLRLAQTAASSRTMLIYADHDRKDDQGARRDPAFKPDASPETLLSSDYIGRAFAIQRDGLLRLNGWRPDHGGAETYDLLLRSADGWTGADVAHVPEILFHLHASANVQDSDARREAEADAVRDALHRRGVAGDVEPLGLIGRRVRLRRPAPSVSLILPTRDRPEFLIKSVGSILSRTDSAAYDLVIVDNGSQQLETMELLDAWSKDPRVRILRDDGGFNFSRLNNEAARLCQGEVLGLVNNDVEVISPDWLTELATWAIQPQIGCVGAKLLYPDHRVQHGGVILGIGVAAAHAHKYADRDDVGYGGRLQLVHNVSAVTAACLFVRRSIYEDCGGLSEALPVNYNDVDFCLKVDAAGYRNIMVPHVELYHHESVSRGRDDVELGGSRIAADAAILAKAWGERLRSDRFYSPNLTQVHENFDLRWRDDESRRRRGRAPWR